MIKCYVYTDCFIVRYCTNATQMAHVKTEFSITFEAFAETEFNGFFSGQTAVSRCEVFPTFWDRSKPLKLRKTFTSRHGYLPEEISQ